MDLAGAAPAPLGVMDVQNLAGAAPAPLGVMDVQDLAGAIPALLLVMLGVAGAGGYVLGTLTGHRFRELWRRRGEGASNGR